MSVGNTKDQGNKGNNFPYQLRTLQLLSSINDGIAALPGVDYETRTSTYQAINNGAGYSIGDILIRYDIIDVATSTVVSTVWFNDTTQATIGAPGAGDITPVSSPSSVTVINGPAGAAVNIQDGGNSITVDDGGTPLGINVNDGSGNPISSTGTSLDVNITNTIPLEVNISQANDSILIYGFDGTNNQPIATSPAGVLQVDILSIPTVDVSGSSISVSNFPAIQDVNILSSVILDVSGSNVLVTGTVTADAGSGIFNVAAVDLDIRDLTYASDSVTVYQGTSPWVVSGTVDIGTIPVVAVSQSGSWTVDINTLPAITISGTVAVTQSGTWDINNIYGTISLPTGAATEATLSTLATEATLTDVKENTTSKINRLKGAADYTRVFTYYLATNNVATIVHTGTTDLGSETLTETFTYQSNFVDGSNVVSIIYS